MPSSRVLRRFKPNQQRVALCASLSCDRSHGETYISVLLRLVNVAAASTFVQLHAGVDVQTLVDWSSVARSRVMTTSEDSWWQSKAPK